VADGAKIATIDFSKTANIRLHRSGKIRHRGNAADNRPVNGEGKLLTPKQIRARQRRAAKRNSKRSMSELEFETLYKPIEEWDLEELARGRPRNIDGNFKGRKPGWINREVHERAMEMFIQLTKSDMAALAPTALTSLRWVLENDAEDEKGKPVVPASAKNQAAMFLLEHVVGKPKQQVQTELSVKLQGILAQVMVNPADALSAPERGGLGYTLGHLPGVTVPMIEQGSSDEEDFDDVANG
jgi:hypothetical protein